MRRKLFPDLTTDILLRFPAKSLLRFRCLSSSFRDEIDHSTFVQMHLKRSIDTRTRRKLFFTRSTNCYAFLEDEEKGVFAADFDDGLRKALQFSNQFTDRSQRGTGIIGTCHGLILLCVQQKGSPTPELELFLWNPTTRRIKKLPPCPGGSLQSAGLGYDSITDDYKVVSIFTDFNTVEEKHPGTRRRTNKIIHKVWVYSLQSNSWRYTQHLDLRIWIHPHPEGFANGFLYWTYSEGNAIKIGCFDIAQEVYITLPGFYLPHDDGLPGISATECTVFGIDILEGDVVMGKHFKVQVHEFYSPVVDKVGGIAGGNWSKAFTFEAKRSRTTRLMVSPLAYSKDGASVLLHIYKDIFWYNMEKKTRDRVKFLRGICKSYPFDCYVVWESLVSLGNDDAFQV